MEDMKFKLQNKKNLGLELPKGDKQDAHLIEETLRLKKLIYESLK